MLMLTLVYLHSTQAETRAEFAERSVAKLEKTIDDLEGRNSSCFHKMTHLATVFYFQRTLSLKLKYNFRKDTFMSMRPYYCQK